MFIPLTPEKYAAAVKGLEAAPKGGDLKSFETSGPNGEIHTSQVDLGFSYDSEKQILGLVVLSKHGLARFASDATIQAHVVDLLNKVDG
jgi:hypothetical protein